MVDGVLLGGWSWHVIVVVLGGGVIKVGGVLEEMGVFVI